MSDTTVGEGRDEADLAAAAEVAAAEAPQVVITVLLLGGLLLVLLGQMIDVPAPRSQLPVYLLQALGGLAFVMGGRTAVRGELPEWLAAVLGPPAAYFGVSRGQVLLLILAPLFALLAFFASGDELLARSAPAAMAGWLLALGCAVGGAVRPAREPWPHIATGEIVLTAVLFGAALLLRGVGTELLPSTFTGDEASAGLSAVAFQDGSANNYLTIGWFDFPALYFALQGVVIKVLGQNFAALRIFSALGGALTVVATYWLGRVTLGKGVGALAAVFLTVSHYHIHMSRIGLNNIWDGFFAAAAVAGLWYGWKSGRRLGFITAGLALGLGQYFYVSIRIVPVLFLVWAGVALVAQRQRFLARLPGLILSAFIAAVIFLPLGFFYAGHPDQFASRMRFVSILGDWMELEMRNTGASEAQILARQLVTSAGGLVKLPLRHWYEAGAPVLLSASAALFIVGALWAVVNLDLMYLLLLLPIAATLLTVTLSQDTPAAQRYVMAMPFVAVLVALPLGLLTGWLRGQWPGRKWITAVPALLVAGWLVYANLQFYFTKAFDSFVLGGTNTVVATEVGRLLGAEEQPGDAYFFGFPRMGYRSHSTIPYLAPQVNGTDVQEPLVAPWSTPLDRATDFIFLPERLSELEYVRLTYPQGEYREFHDRDGMLLFALYAVK